LKFIEACRSRVLKFTKLQTEDSIRLGQWMDWGNDYYTMSDNNNLHNWFLLKEYHKRGWLYKGKDAVPWCPRCGTAVSKHDILTEGYFEITEPSIFMKFPILGKKNEYLLIFTTTPWTIPADVALAVHPNKYYVKVKQGDEYFLLIETRTDELKGKFEIVQKLIGSDLVGLVYEMPYAGLPAQKNAKATYPVVGWDLVSDEEGTGIVHIAPGCGPEDYELGQVERLPAISPLNEEGIYTEGYDWLTDKYASDADLLIIKDLKKRGFIYKIEDYTHRYPHCWRCKTKLIFRLVPEWYIKADKIREKLIEENKKIKWYPEYGQKRQEAWFNNMREWMISQKRYWGLPLPIWECPCGHFEVIGSLAELKKKAVKGIKQLKEIHKPWIDNVIIKCPKCKKEVKRIPDIGITWLDAGIVPFSTIGPYLKNKKYWKEWFPAEFICENLPGQYRGWFNAILWSSITLANKACFKAILGYESVKDEKGQEMHKSLGNVIWAKDALNKIGADPLRLAFCLHDPEKEFWFGYNSCDEAKKALNVLLNTHILILKTAEYLKINPSKSKLNNQKLKLEDKWILSRLNSLIENYTKELESLHPHIATAQIKDFWLEDLSRGYVHFIRERLARKDKTALMVLYFSYFELLKLLAPITPFITEQTYHDFKSQFKLKEESIHLLAWPKPDKRLIDTSLEKEISLIKEIASSILALREKAGRGIRWPIKSAIIVTKDKSIKNDVTTHQAIICRMANVQAIELAPELKDIEYKIKSDYPKLAPKFKKDVAEVIRRIAEQSPESLMRKLAKEGNIVFKLSSGKKAKILREDLIIEKCPPKGFVGLEAPTWAVYIDLAETEQMIASGFAREITRAVQSMRKKAGLKKQDRIDLMIATDEQLAGQLKPHPQEIAEKVGARALTLSKKAEVETKEYKQSLKIRNKTISIGFDVA